MITDKQSLFNLTEHQIEVLEKSGWKFGESEDVLFAENLQKKEALYGNFVKDFLHEEAEELIRSESNNIAYTEVSTPEIMLDCFDYEIINYDPLTIKHKPSGKIITGHGANFIFTEAIRKY